MLLLAVAVWSLGLVAWGFRPPPPLRQLQAVHGLATVARTGRVVEGLGTARQHRHRHRHRLCSAMDEMDWDPKSAPKLDFDEDFYKVLEVPRDIEQKDLKRAYYKMVFKYHPDNKEGDEAKALCNKQMMVINAAYKVLKEPTLRARYDAGGRGPGIKTPPNAGSSSSGGGSSSRTPNSQQWQQQQQQQRPPSTAGTAAAAAEAVESLGDIFSELWGELRTGGAANLFEELVDYLEDQVPGSKVSSGATQTRTSQQQTTAEMDAEAAVLTSALANFKIHLDDLSKLRDDEEKQILASSRQQAASTDKPKTVEELQARLAKIEALRAVEARIEVVNKQIRQLQRQVAQLQRLKSAASEPRTRQGGGVGGGGGSNYVKPSSAVASRELVDQELAALKRKMGIK